MSVELYLPNVRDCLWSEVCNTDSVSYLKYLTLVERLISYGECASEVSGRHGAGECARSCGCGAHFELRIDNSSDSSGSSETNNLVDRVTDRIGDVGSQDNGYGDFSQKRFGKLDCRVPVGHVGDNGDGLCDLGVHSSVLDDERRKRDSQFDARTMGSSSEVLASRGKNWARNRAKKVARKQRRMNENWRRTDGSGGCVSDSSASIVTVDTRTGVEIEAAQTLAARRVVENKLAIAKGEVQLRSFANKDKTKALERLDAARMEQRINEAKAKSQASYKKCDESMKSLGSTGSAGEFALKQEVKRAKDNAAILAYVQAQADFMVKHVSPEVLAQVAAMPPPVLENEFDVFGDCPENYTEDQRESYFLGLARQQEENDMRTGIPC